MQVVGATIVRDALRLDYPVVPAIRSVAPLVDLMVVNVGRSQDDTLEYLRDALTGSNVVLLDREWNPDLGGTVLAAETQVAIQHADADWVIYVQADEILHDDGVGRMREGMERHLADDRVEGLLVDFVHHYGNPDSRATARTWYRREVRVVKPRTGVRSFHEAQGFRGPDGKRKIRAAVSGATYHHYGWARPRTALEQKSIADFAIYGRKAPKGLSQLPWEYGLKPFGGRHPSVMTEWISKRQGSFASIAPRRWDARQLRLLGSHAIERITRRRLFEYRNYEIV